MYGQDFTYVSHKISEKKPERENKRKFFFTSKASFQVVVRLCVWYNWPLIHFLVSKILYFLWCVCVSLSRCQEWRANNRLFIFSYQRKNWYKKTNLWKMFYLLWIFACVHFRWAANRKPMNNVLNSRCDVNAQIDASIYLKIRLRIRRSINASRWANT